MIKLSMSHESGTEQVRMETSKKSERTPQNVCDDVADHAYMHGLAGIKRETNLYKRIFWVLVFVGAIAALLWQTTTMVQKYYSYTTTTNLVIRYEHILEFPAVTVCNINPVRWKLLKASPWAADFVKKMEKPLIPITTNASAKKRWATDINVVVDRDDYVLRQNFTRVFRSLDPAEQMRLGHQFDEMLIDCAYLNMQCAPKLFTMEQNPVYGNCFTFDPSSMARKGSKYVSGTGPQNGLSLSFYIEQENYVKAMTDDAGVVVVIHNLNEMPFPEDHGIPLAPGFRTLVGLKKTVIERLKHPYGKCRNVSTAEGQKMMGFTGTLQKFGFTEAACQKRCLQCKLVEQCGCFEATLSSSLECIGPGTPMCTKLNETQLLCSSDVKANISRFCSAKECPPMCRQITYKTSIASSQWPALHKQTDLVEDVCKFQPHLCQELTEMTVAQRGSYMNENFVKLDVYFEHLSFAETKSVPQYVIGDLLSDLGGTMGLWMGLSVIAVIEIVEFILAFTLAVCRKLHLCRMQEIRPIKETVGMEKY